MRAWGKPGYFRWAALAILLAAAPIVALSVAPMAARDAAAAEAAAESPPARVLGRISFPTGTKSEAAQEAFIQGMLLLHLFEYPYSRERFLER